MKHSKGLKTGILSWKSGIIFFGLLVFVCLTMFFEERADLKSSSENKSNKSNAKKIAPDEIYFGPYERQKEIVLDTEFETPWIKTPKHTNCRIDVTPDSGFHIRFLDGAYFNVKKNDWTWFGERRAIFKLRAKEKGQKAVISIEHQ